MQHFRITKCRKYFCLKTFQNYFSRFQIVSLLFFGGEILYFTCSIDMFFSIWTTDTFLPKSSYSKEEASDIIWAQDYCVYHLGSKTEEFHLKSCAALVKLVLNLNRPTTDSFRIGKSNLLCNRLFFSLLSYE